MSEKVLVPFSLKKTSSNPNANYTHFVRGAYLVKLAKLDLIPIFVSPSMTDQQIDDLCLEAKGLLLCGGNDIEPSIYGEQRHALTEPATIERDNLEIKLIKRFEAANLPILGICRGCQILAVAFGGKLNQHLPDLGLAELHGQSEEKGEEHPKHPPRHDVLVDESSAIFKILGKKTVNINSLHHQSIKSLDLPMRVVGRTRAGSVELIEHTDAKQFIFGVQGHPELEVNGELELLWQSFAERVKA